MRRTLSIAARKCHTYDAGRLSMRRDYLNPPGDLSSEPGKCVTERRIDGWSERRVASGRSGPMLGWRARPLSAVSPGY